MQFVVAACNLALLQNEKKKGQSIAAASSSNFSQINLNSPLKENLLLKVVFSNNMISFLKFAQSKEK